jgi:hypothetical protein
LRIRYVGVHAAGVEVAELDFEHVEHGTPTEIPDDIARRLLQQVGNWDLDETPEQKAARELREANEAEQEAAAAKAADAASAEARKRVAAEQAKRQNGSN